MLALEKITDQNSDQIELEIEKKLSWFAQKLSKMTQIKLKVRHSTIRKCYFDLIVHPSMTVGQLAETIIMVGLIFITQSEFTFQKHNSIAGTSETVSNKLKIKPSGGSEMNMTYRDYRLKELTFADKTTVTYFFN